MTVARTGRNAQMTLPGLSLPLTCKRVARARHFSLRYRPLQGDALLTLPARASLAQALQFAESRKDWLLQQVGRAPARVAFADGVEIPVLGERLLLRHSPRARGVRKDEGVLYVGGGEAFFSRRVRDWVQAQIKREAGALARRYANILGTQVRRIAVKDTSSRWGSCSHAGDITFSWRLAFAPEAVLAYVAAHEAAHLQEMSHSPRFWVIVQELCPAWREARDWLKREGAGLYRYG
jgi:hypothetical protein